MKKNILVKLIVIVIGLVIIGVGVYLNLYKPEGMGRAKAVVTKVKQTEQSILYNKYDVFLKFKAEDGTVYEDVIFESYSTDMKEGAQLAILYDLSDPTKIETNQMDRYAFYAYIVGIVLTVGGIIKLFTGSKEKTQSSYGKLY